MAVVLALGVAAGGAGTVAATGAGGAGTSAGRSGGEGAQVRARARSTARAVQRLESRGLRVEQRGVEADDDCAAHSYGDVQDFFEDQPCTALYRGLFEVRDGRAVAVVAVAWVDMPDPDQALEFQQLVDRHGTGNVTELGPGSVRWTGERYASGRDGLTVVNAQAEPVGRTAQAVRLADLAAGTAVG